MNADPDNNDALQSDALAERLFAPQPMGGDIFVQRTVEAVRRDVARRRRRRRWRRLAIATSSLAASAAILFALGQSAGTGTEMVEGAEVVRTADAATEPSSAEAALYGEMLALEELLTDADVLAQEENRQTLDMLMLLAQQ